MTEVRKNNLLLKVTLIADLNIVVFRFFIFFYLGVGAIGMSDFMAYGIIYDIYNIFMAYTNI